MGFHHTPLLSMKGNSLLKVVKYEMTKNALQGGVQAESLSLIGFDYLGVSHGR